MDMGSRGRRGEPHHRGRRGSCARGAHRRRARPGQAFDLAGRRMQPKIAELRLALVGRRDEHHALLPRMHLDHIDQLQAMEARLDGEVDKLMAPFAETSELLQSVPGIGQPADGVIISEMGIDMDRFPSAHHLASWAGLCPGSEGRAIFRRRLLHHRRLLAHPPRMDARSRRRVRPLRSAKPRHSPTALSPPRARTPRPSRHGPACGPILLVGEPAPPARS